AALQRRQIDLPAVTMIDHAPGAELVRERERVCRCGTCQRTGHPPYLVATGDLHDDVVVGRWASEQPVSQRAADEPPVLGDRRERAEWHGHQSTHYASAPSRW